MKHLLFPQIILDSPWNGFPIGHLSAILNPYPKLRGRNIFFMPVVGDVQATKYNVAGKSCSQIL
jgi:hypothetical protein